MPTQLQTRKEAPVTPGLLSLVWTLWRIRLARLLLWISRVLAGIGARLFM
jgi:hypothetical protein